MLAKLIIEKILTLETGKQKRQITIILDFEKDKLVKSDVVIELEYSLLEILKEATIKDHLIIKETTILEDEIIFETIILD